MLRKGLLFHRFVFCLFALLLAVGLMVLLHGEKGRPEVLVEVAHIFELGRELRKVFMLQRILSTNPLVGIVGKQLGKDVFDILGAACRQKFIHSDTLLGGKVDVHVGCLALEAIQYLLLGGSKDVIDPMNLIQFVLARKEWLFGDQLEQNASEPPNIHLLVIVAVGHQTLRGAIPSSRDIVGVGGG